MSPSFRIHERLPSGHCIVQITQCEHDTGVGRYAILKPNGWLDSRRFETVTDACSIAERMAIPPVVTKPVREDALKLHDGRYYVPTIYGKGDDVDTIWVDSWEQFKAVGGGMCWSEDQTEIELTLPVRHKFSIQFMRLKDKPGFQERGLFTDSEMDAIANAISNSDMDSDLRISILDRLS